MGVLNGDEKLINEECQSEQGNEILMTGGESRGIEKVNGMDLPHETNETRWRVLYSHHSGMGLRRIIFFGFGKRLGSFQIKQTNWEIGEDWEKLAAVECRFTTSLLHYAFNQNRLRQSAQGLCLFRMLENRQIAVLFQLEGNSSGRMLYLTSSHTPDARLHYFSC